MHMPQDSTKNLKNFIKFFGTKQGLTDESRTQNHPQTYNYRIGKIRYQNRGRENRVSLTQERPKIL